MTDELEIIKKTGKLPKHVAVIMDGNGRFAKKHRRPRVWGHQKGAARVREIIETSAELGVGVLTLYAFSEENWNRPAFEVKTIMTLIRTYLTSEIKLLIDNNIVFRMTGNRERLAKETLRVIEDTEAATKNNSGMILNIALSYGSRSEMIDAAQSLALKVQNGDITVDSIDDAAFSAELLTSDLPDPDLMIRTSGEQRISNFLLWQLAYAELYFTKVLWPEFGREQYLQALQSYAQRDRRFGNVTYEASDLVVEDGLVSATDNNEQEGAPC